MGKLWGIAALTALSLTACGGDMGYHGGGTLTDNGRTAYDGTTAYGDGVTGGAYGDGVTGGAYGDGVTNRDGVTGGAYDDGVTNRDGVTEYGVTDSYGAAERNARSNGTVTNDDGVTDRDGNAERSALERASEALEDGVQRARDGVENMREHMNP